MKFKKLIKANKTDEIVLQIVNKLKAEKDNIGDLDEWVNEQLQESFSYMDDVIEVFKEIAQYEDEIYSQISDAVWSYLKDEILDTIEKEI